MNKEMELFNDLISWIKDKYPRVFNTYIKIRDKDKRREMAKEMLKFRLQQEPESFINFPASIFKKLEIDYTSDPKNNDEKINRLAQLTGGQIVARINGTIPIPLIDFIEMNKKNKKK